MMKCTTLLLMIAVLFNAQLSLATAGEPKRIIEHVVDSSTSRRPCKAITVNDVDAFENEKGERFFGKPEGVRVAGEMQRDEVWNILETLISLRERMSMEHYQAAQMIMRGFYTFMTENHQICFEAWTKFRNGDTQYGVYSGDERFRFGPHVEGSGLETRAQTYFTTLVDAFNFAVQHNKVLVFFTNAFPRFVDDTIDLKQAHEAQKRWLEAQQALR